MAKGQIAKQEITAKLLEVFEGSFLYNDGKEIRVPIQENGELVQIKITLTAAKTNVEPGDENALPTAAAQDNRIDFVSTNEVKDTIVEPTQEEKENLKNMLKIFGL